MPIRFVKISATGNDFILIDNRDGKLDIRRDAVFFSHICQRRRSVGADGVILLQKSDRADFHYVHINSNGSVAEMCGNGTRAVYSFAKQLGIVADQGSFEINGNLYHAKIVGNKITTEFVPPGKPDLDVAIVDEPSYQAGGFIDTGVPHFVIFVPDVQLADVAGLGRKYRHHPFFPHGTNVDFVQVDITGGLHLPGGAHLMVRTFERGVEEETLACGTGAVASAIIAHLRKSVQSPVQVTFPGGDLIVTFDADFTHISLSGEVTRVYEGVLQTLPEHVIIKDNDL